jgi:hypothetical protein
MPAKPWPLDVMTRSRMWTSMSSQCEKLDVMASKVAASAARKFSSV